MVIMLFMVDITATLVAILFFGCSYGLINYFVKNKLRKIGRERLEANKERFRMANEALSSIKTTKVMGIEAFFLRSYSYYSRKFAYYNVFALSLIHISWVWHSNRILMISENLLLLKL